MDIEFNSSIEVEHVYVYNNVYFLLIIEIGNT